MKKIIVSLLVSFVLMGSLFRPVVAVEPVTTVTLIIFAGKVYAISSRVASGLTAMGNMAITGSIARESEAQISSFIRSIDENIDKAGSEAYGAPSEQEAKEALERQASLKILKEQYKTLLREVKLNKNLTVSNIAKNEIQEQGVGFILAEFGVPDEAQGGVSSWSIQKAIELGGYEITERGSDLISSVYDLSKGVWQAGGNIVSGRIFGNNIDFGELSEADKEFYNALKEGRATRMKVAITKAEWDHFVDVTAKEEFKQYLRGESDKFSKLPLSVQQKYWGMTWLFSDQVDEIHDLMKKARESGNYAEAIRQIMEKYPKYADLFKSLSKDASGDTKELMDRVIKAFQEEAEKQKEELRKAEEEAPTPKQETQKVQENLPRTAEEAIDEAKQLSPQQTKASCLAYFDRMCRGLCGNEAEGYDFCMQGCMANTASCNNLP